MFASMRILLIDLRAMEKPEIKKDINIEKVLEACKEYIDFLDSEDYHEDDVDNYEHDFFEKALEAVCGEDVFDCVNEKIV